MSERETHVPYSETKTNGRAHLRFQPNFKKCDLLDLPKLHREVVFESHSEEMPPLWIEAIESRARESAVVATASVNDRTVRHRKCGIDIAIKNGLEAH